MECIYLVPFTRLEDALCLSHTKMTAAQLDFSVLLKDTSTYGQRRRGIEQPTMRILDGPLQRLSQSSDGVRALTMNCHVPESPPVGDKEEQRLAH